MSPTGASSRTDFVVRPLGSTVLDVAADPRGRVYVLNHRESRFGVDPGPGESVWEVLPFTSGGTLDTAFADAGVLALDRPYAPSAIARR